MVMSLKLTPLFLIAAFQFDFIDASQPGYTYISSTCGAWYKLHNEQVSWYAARDKCRSERAVLFHPGSESELGLVLSTLSVGNGPIHSGLSDLDKHKEYKTLDGHTIAEVYSKWRPGEPSYFSCGRLDVGPNELYMYTCEGSSPMPRRFICKISNPTEPEVDTPTEDVNTTVVNSSDKHTLIMEKLVEAAANQAAASDRLTVNLAALLERVAEADTHQVAAMQQLTSAIGLLASSQVTSMQQLTATIGLQLANQTAAAERSADADANQAAAIQQLTAAVGLHFGNQTAIMERQALALEALAASSQDENSQ